jgi:PAS domain S-box-containing protein
LETLAVALVAGVLGPAIMALLAGRQLRKAKVQDWERQDLVVKQAQEAARLLLESNENIAKTTADVNKTVTGKLDTIKTLVDGTLTAAIQAELTATQREDVMHQEVIDLKRAAGGEPSAASVATLKATKARIKELEKTLEERRNAERLTVPEQSALTLFENVVRELPQAVIVAGSDSIVRFANDAALTLFGHSHMQGRHLTELMPERYRPKHLAGMARYRQTRESTVLNQELAVHALLADGTEVPIRLTISPVNGGEGKWFAGFIQRRDEEAGSPIGGEHHLGC